MKALGSKSRIRPALLRRRDGNRLPENLKIKRRLSKTLIFIRVGAARRAPMDKTHPNDAGTS
jgi:hypothetical protein